MSTTSSATGEERKMPDGIPGIPKTRWKKREQRPLERAPGD
jgi:hypothetical protein